MKPFSVFQLTTGVMAFLAMALTSDLQAAAMLGKEKMGTAKIQRISGSATYVENGKVATLKEGMTLGEGATINTTPGSRVQVWLGDNGQLLEVIENTSVTIKTLRLETTPADVKATTELELKPGGGLVGNVKKLSAASKFDVKYAEGVAGIRGTQWAILPNIGVICSEGSVQVTFIVNGVPSVVTIGAGQIALPPTTPGGAPRVIDGIPTDVAQFLVDIFNPEPPTGPDNKPIGPPEQKPSANIGSRGGRVTVVVEPQYND